MRQRPGRANSNWAVVAGSSCEPLAEQLRSGRTVQQAAVAAMQQAVEQDHD